MTILIATSYKPVEWVEHFKTLFPDRNIVTLGEPFDRRSVHYAIVWNQPEGSLSGLPNLAAVFSVGAGIDHITRDSRLPDVPVIRVINPNLTVRMGEYVVLHCLRYLRAVDYFAQCQREKRWASKPGAPYSGDVRVGIMGYGVLGADAGAKLKMIGFNVAGWTRSRHEPVECVALFSGHDGLDAFLARTDILVCLLPLTEETRGILNLELFGKLAKDGVLGGPFLINCGRGHSQVEADIVTALDTGVLQGATLDVFETEPLPQDSPLWEHPKVTITPHVAAFSSREHISKSIAEGIRRIERGELPEGLVDMRRGY